MKSGFGLGYTVRQLVVDFGTIVRPGGLFTSFFGLLKLF